MPSQPASNHYDPRLELALLLDSSRRGSAKFDIHLFKPAYQPQRKLNLKRDPHLEENEAVCWFDKKMRATCICQNCGRFSSDPYVVEWENEPLCLLCLEDWATKEENPKMARSRKLHDSNALTLSILGAGFWWMASFPPPAFYFVGFIPLLPILFSLYLVLRFWKKGPTSVVRTSAWRYPVALVLDMAALALWSYSTFTAFT